MDRTLNSSLLGNRSPFSPRSRQTILSKRTAPPQSFRKSSRFSISARSTQSVQVVLKTQSNCVERFGQALPVLITEALTFADRNTVVSAKVSSECGYAWLVCGRRLLIWQYRQSPVPMPGTPSRRGALTNQCYELQLPQSDLAHRAELVSVFVGAGNSIPSCIAVSPEGVVRFWAAIAHEGVYVEQLVDLQGQECDSLTGVEGLGCILATTTCTVVLVKPQVSSGRQMLNCHTLKMPSGWLGGLSKKFSLIFGPINSEQSTETRLVRVLSVPVSESHWYIYVLAGHSIQKWHLSQTDPEQLIYATDLSRLVREGFYGTVWENCGSDNSDTDTWILDLQTNNDSIILLTAAVNLHLSPQIHYSIITVDTSGAQPPSQFSNFQLLRMSGLYREDNPGESLGYRFLFAAGNYYIYNHRCITVIKPQEDPDCLEFNSSQDFLLGGSVCVNTPVFFSRNHGLVVISGNELGGADMSLTGVFSPGPGTPADTSFADGGVENLTVYNFNPDEMYAAYKDTGGQLRAAFIFHIKNQHAACNDILQELFLTNGALPGVDTVLDKVIVSVSEDFLNDIPANDPRWLGEHQVGLGSSYAMQVHQQLEDKQKAHMLFIKFLKDTELWQKLSAVIIRGGAMATPYVLSEHSEKIVAAIAMKTLPYEGVVRVAVEAVAEEMGVDSESGLTNQDVFYRQVTNIYKALQQMVNRCEETAHSELNPLDVARLISDTNVVYLSVFKEIMQYRWANLEHFAPDQTALNFCPDYLPWTSSTGSQGLMESLLTQQHLTITYGARSVSEFSQKNTLYEQFVALTDYILDGRKTHLESLKNTEREGILMKQYQTDRRKLIEPLVEDGRWEGAASLAEKYLDFETLAIICDRTENQPRLDEYMDRFGQDGFTKFLFNWNLQENRQGKLMDICRTRHLSHRNMHQLRAFLSQHPTLSWIQDAFDKKFDQSANTLKKLAMEETESLTRQKTMFSMAKLGKLAAGFEDDEEELQLIDSHLNLINLQEEIPDYVLQLFGYDTARPRVIPARDLVHMCVCPEFRDATELEFKKALDLLEYVPEAEGRGELLLMVWRRAILRDQWNERNLDCPLDVLQNKLFFKTVDLALVLGADPSNLLPPLDLLIEDSSLEELQDNKNFQFLIKTGYEHVNSIMSRQV